MIKNGVFCNEKEEINFFRNVKPQFTCYIEFFILLSRGLLFMPANRPATRSINSTIAKEIATRLNDSTLFWEQEEKRFNFFCKKNENFINYYKCGQNSNDANYFLRKNNNCKYVPVTQVYDVDKNYRSANGHLIGMYLAHKLYNEYVRERLNGLKLLPAQSKALSDVMKSQIKKRFFKRTEATISIIFHKLNNVIERILKHGAASGQQKNKQISDFRSFPEEMNPGY
jgi:hypothetical protein